jgi:hypothetical protein
MHIVTLNTSAGPFFLRSTIWTSYRDRATEFATPEAARSQLNKAKPFMKATMFKAARVEAA